MRIGIDLGGTKIEGIALDRGGSEVRRRRVATPRGDYSATLLAIKALVLAFEAVLGFCGSVGIGHPGAVSPATGLVNFVVMVVGTRQNDPRAPRHTRSSSVRINATFGRPSRILASFCVVQSHGRWAAGVGIVFGVDEDDWAAPFISHSSRSGH
jgi:hypothetical protein